jgi:cold shock CspA family protein
LINRQPPDRQNLLDLAAIAAASLPGPMPEVGQYGAGVIKWSGGMNNQTGRENDFGFIETQTGELFFHRSSVLSPWEQFTASKQVMFRCVKSRGAKMAASEVDVFEVCSDEALLKFLPTGEDLSEVVGSISTEVGLLRVFCTSSGILRHESLKRLVKSASKATLSKLAKFIKSSIVVDDRADFLNILDSSMLLRPEALSLRRILPRHLHLRILAALSSLNDHHAEALSAVKKPDNKVYDESIFWNTFPPKHPKEPLYSYAPEWLKGQVCRTHYGDFVIRWNGLFDHLANVSTTLDAAPVYKSLTRADRDLAELWAGKGASEPTLARMLSARAAEIAAMTFYRDQGCEVEDVAIGQTSGNGQDWRTHDLLIDGAHAIDVKNSRRPTNNKRLYVDHTVAKFKLDRTNRSVIITGIISPYIGFAQMNETVPADFFTIAQILGPRPDKAGIEEIIYLGETHADHFEKLVQAYQTPGFTVDRGRRQIVPNWLFDYPAVWYKHYDAGVRALVDDCAWPQEDEWHYTLDDESTEDSLQKICAIGIEAPEWLAKRLHGWKAEFYAKLSNVPNTLPRLPAIYLMVMRDFVENLSNPPPGFSPADYKSLLFSAGVQNSNMIPLATIDPLCILATLIETLCVLWSERESLQLGKLVTFKLTGLGILRGKAIDDSNWTSILAYCGGKTYRMERGRIELDPQGKPMFAGRCGHAPLILGSHKTCTTCRYLICDMCQFCCTQCEVFRLAKLVKDENKTNESRSNDSRRISPRGQPGGKAFLETGENGIPFWLNEPPDWDIPIEAHERDH